MQNGKLSYDFYVAILHNKSNTFENVNMRIRAQQFYTGIVLSKLADLVKLIG